MIILKIINEWTITRSEDPYFLKCFLILLDFLRYSYINEKVIFDHLLSSFLSLIRSLSHLSQTTDEWQMQFLGMVLISKKKYKSTILFLSSKLYFQLLYLSNQLKYPDESKTSISIIPSISRMDSNDTYISHTKIIDTLHLF